MGSPAHNHYGYHSPTLSDIGRSRQSSDAMDIQSIPEGESATRTAAIDGAWNRNGSRSMSPMVSNNFDHDNAKRYPPDYEENGRIYHGFRKGVYFLPCDEQEQDRLDIFHKLFTVARHGHLIYAPFLENLKKDPKNGRILDLGCGTGIWAIDVAKKYPEIFVAGVDLAPIQPPNRPRNCEFYAPFDFESSWAMGEEDWDLVHLRMGGGSVLGSGWPNLYRRVFAHLKPGGWFEQIEIDFEPKCDDRSLDGTALGRWYHLLKEATARTMRPISHNYHHTEADLKKAGFVNVVHQMAGLPLNPWIQDDHERTVARWYNLAVSESIETLSLAPFSRVFGWSQEEILQLAAEVKKEAFNKDIHAYNLLHIYTAQKPGLVSS
ncbi:class I SAM-dependent methyltransferase [Aspergillus undulatus]|uniref:class I SAM-dependent methyltransferase n=1 Tax=Aspergillus undulatus TaxID=1810928 RepID=UPI003CCDFB4D